MNEKPQPGEEPVDRLVRAHLETAAQTVDATGMLAGVKARTAARKPASTRSTPRAAGFTPAARPWGPRWRGRVALALAAGILLAVVLALPVATPRASAETLVRLAQQAHARPVELCYFRTESNPHAEEDDILPLPRSARLWVRGEQFCMVTPLAKRRSVWGRDAQGRVWFAPTRRAGFRFAPHEIPESLARSCDRLTMDVDRLLAQLLAHFELRCDDTRTDRPVVEARPRPGRSASLIRFVRLELDPRRKLIRRVELHRRLPKGPTRISFTLVENLPPREDSHYTLEGHLAVGARIYSLDAPPPLRLKLLRNHYRKAFLGP